MTQGTLQNQPAPTAPLEYRGTDISPPAVSTRRRAMVGSAWTLGGYAGTQFLRLGSNLVLSRLLFPEAFGILAVVTLLIQGLEMFSDVGIGPSIIQHKRGKDPVFLNTAWTVQVIRGFALWLCAIAIAWPAAWFYGKPEMLMLLPAAGFTAVFAGFRSTAWFTVNRDLALGRRTLVEVGATGAGIAVMIQMAYLTESIWSLVAGMLTVSALMSAGSHLFLPGVRAAFAWEAEACKALFGFGKWIFINTLVGFVGTQIDRLMLLKLVGSAFTGIYSIAFMLATVPMQAGLQLTQVVLYPVLAEAARSDHERLRKGLQTSRRAILPMCMTGTLAVLLLSPAFFHTLYDERYHDAGWIGQLLAVAVWFSLLRGTSDRALLALGDSRSIAFSNIVRLVVTVGASLGGYYLWGGAGFIWGVALGTFVGLVIIDVELEARKLPVALDDLTYTLAVAALGAAGVYGPALIAQKAGLSRWYEYGMAGMIVAAVGAWAALAMLKALKQRRNA